MHQLLQPFRSLLLHVGIFSFFINLALLVPPLYMLQVFDRVLASRTGETLLMLTLGAAFLLVMMLLLDHLRARMLVAGGLRLDRLLGERAFRESLSRAAEGRSTPESQMVMRDAGVVRNFLAGNAVVALFDLPWLPFYLLIITLFHPLMGAVAFVGMALLFGVAVLNERLSRQSLEALQLSSRRAGRVIDTSMRNAETIQAMGMLNAITARWQSVNQETMAEQAESGRTQAAMNSTGRFLRQMLQVAMMGTGAWLTLNEASSPGIMLAATILIGRALQPLESVLANWKQMVDARAAWQRMEGVLDAQANVERLSLPRPAGRLDVENLTFLPKGRERPVVQDLSIKLDAGESLGIVGPSAAGKSSLARLLLGVWRPTVGVVRLDGADIARWPRDEIGQHVGYLPQDIELFNGTLAQNIARMAIPDSDAVIAAAKLAHAHEFILRLPNGYDTPVGEGGVVLSGGQRQRVALARALYGEPCFVVLDEPNANLDADGELALVAALRDLKSRRVTVVLITHKPSLLSSIDKVLVMRDGRAEIFGPRDAVLARILPPGAAPAAATAPAGRDSAQGVAP
jgi:PrtD family type I secretion system ABC transporter